MCACVCWLGNWSTKDVYGESQLATKDLKTHCLSSVYAF